MPKNAKPVPPQQSSLMEMWGGKKKQKDAAVQPEPIQDVNEDDMDVDHVEAETGQQSVIYVPQSGCLMICGIQGAHKATNQVQKMKLSLLLSQSHPKVSIDYPLDPSNYRSDGPNREHKAQRLTSYRQW